MKQLLFLLLFPCLALAQYTGNAGQKITLGEQTTADGLVFRGVASIDTVTATSKITRANKQDTSAYLLLDTVTNLLWHYKIGSNAWTQAGGGVSVTSFSAGTTGLTPSTATTGAVTLGGTLAVANGGTNTSTLTANKVMVGNGTSGVLTPTDLHWDNSNSRLGIGTTEPDGKLTINTVSASLAPGTQTLGTMSFGEHTPGMPSISGKADTNKSGLWIGSATHNSNSEADLRFGVRENDNSDFTTLTSRAFDFTRWTTSLMTILRNGNVGIGTTTPAVQLHTTGAVRFATFAGGGTTTLSVDNTGNLARTSSIELKKDVTPISYGLNEILQINPINFNWIDEDKFGNENENGFIAEDVMSIIPNVVAADTHGLFMDYTKLIPILTKAIQEQQALIKALEQRILTLENK